MAKVVIMLLFWKRSVEVVSVAVAEWFGAAQKLEWKFFSILPIEVISFKKLGIVMSGAKVPADISGHMLDLDEEDDLEVFSKVK